MTKTGLGDEYESIWEGLPGEKLVENGSQNGTNINQQFDKQLVVLGDRFGL